MALIRKIHSEVLRDLWSAMIVFRHVGYRQEADLLPIDAHHHVGYHYHHYEVHYHRFGRGEDQLASQRKFPNPPPEANLAVGFLVSAPSRDAPAE